MKNTKKGFVVPLVLAIIAVLAIGGGVYVYRKNLSKEVNKAPIVNLPVSNPETVVATTTVKVVSVQQIKSVPAKTSVSSATVSKVSISPLSIYMQMTKEVSSASTYEQLLAITRKYGSSEAVQASTMSLSGITPTVQQKTVAMNLMKSVIPSVDKIVSSQEKINGVQADVNLVVRNSKGGTSNVDVKFVKESGVWKYDMSIWAQ